MSDPSENHPPPPAEPAAAAPVAGDADDSEPTVTFKVKASSSDKAHIITMPLSTTISELKTHLGAADIENVPADRQRLIYSGRVMKNEETLATYKVKDNMTVHMVKSAASNTQGSSGPGAAAALASPGIGSGPSSAGSAQGVPHNMASGTANNPLAGLTGARYAGMASLPSRDLFGADGGLGPPPSEEDMLRLMQQPEYRQMMTQLLDNPEMINMTVQSHPLLRGLPGARELLQSPLMRSLLTNPDMITAFSDLRRNLRGSADEAFPAPGATDSTPPGAPASDSTPAGTDAGGARAGFPPMDLNGLRAFAAQRLSGASDPAIAAAAGDGDAGAAAPTLNTSIQDLANLTARLQRTMQTVQALENVALNLNAPAVAPPPVSVSDHELLRVLLGGQAAPADTRPPEIQYQLQLRQLNEMGFYDFERNVTALRRSGGNVQGAVDHLLGGGF